MERIEYPYQPSWKVIIAVTAMFGACLALFAYKSATNDRGVIINDVVELGPTGATIFYAVLAACSATFVLAGVLLALARTRFEHRLVIDADGIELPKRPWKALHQRIAFADVTDVRHVTMNGNQWIAVKHRDGTTNIDRNRLPTKADFEIVMRAIVSRVTPLGADIDRQRSASR